MNGSDDYPDEMGRRDQDPGFEALLRGDPAGEEHPLAAFVSDLRRLGRQAEPSPSSELTILMASGGLPDAAAAQMRRPAGMTTLFKSLPSRLAGLGVAAKVALATGVAAASAGGAVVGVAFSSNHESQRPGSGVLTPADGGSSSGPSVGTTDTTAEPTDTQAPDTATPQATETEAPDTATPEATDTEAPDTEAPDTEAPDTESPETATPEPTESEAPETSAPTDSETAAPSVDQTETPDSATSTAGGGD